MFQIFVYTVRQIAIRHYTDWAYKIMTEISNNTGKKYFKILTKRNPWELEYK
jgi:hypothetical protein